VVRGWRRSLRLRVVTTTVALSLLVVALLGTYLSNRIAAGLVSAKVEAALAESTAGTRGAQQTFDAAPPNPDASTVAAIARQEVSRLAGAGGQAGRNEILLLRAPSDASTVASDFATGGADEASLPLELRRRVQASSEGDQAWTYLRMRSTGGRTVPGVVVGSRVEVPGAGTYELYHLFPLDDEERTLDLVQRTLLVAGAVLVLLVGLIAYVVTRQVVTPVRMAARIAERLAAGRLEERMHVRGEDDLARLAASFNKMATNLQRQIRQLEDLSRVQRRFVSDVSHELRTPLTTVRMAADVLHESRADFSPSVGRSAELLQAQLDRFEALLTDLLEISRFDAGAAVLEPDPIDLRELAARVLDATQPLAEHRGSALVLDVPPTPCIAEVDARRIERVVRNLVVNAIEHGEGREVTVTVRGGPEAVAVAVRDHGVGLKPGESALVFNRFWRADPARARTTGGTGLGLSIAMEDAHLHGGWLQAWGEPGDGSHFRLTVPSRAGTDLAGSPITLEPLDAARRSTAMVGGPYRRTVAGQHHDADKPKADSPEADSPEADSPEADSPEADSPEADNPEADDHDADDHDADLGDAQHAGPHHNDMEPSQAGATPPTARAGAGEGPSAVDVPATAGPLWVPMISNRRGSRRGPSSGAAPDA
jgi:two-component system sensor histidine kinase MtrB